MSIFIIWPVAADAAFRDAYMLETGESVQALPLTDAQGVHYIVGSNRLTAAQCENLRALVSADISFGASPSALEWMPASTDH